MQDSAVSGINAQCVNGNRLEELLDALNLPRSKLSDEQYQQLVSLEKSYSDVYTLTDMELGYTSVVKHVMDTGDHPPIRLQPYRVPVIYRERSLR